uniref:Uncharacterized protein LOC113784480 n=1 Tax=Cicer arietinum TaxID=3827 RepID=A0A3Q7YBE4_CICAR|nr:uncharacterized protein LOC113784480 [Cicer arietinum]
MASGGHFEFSPSSDRKEDTKFCARPTSVHRVRLRINHGGSFVNHPVKMYVCAQVDEMNWSWDVDLMSHMQITKMVKSLGYMSFKSLWYQHPKYSFTRGLRPLNNDEDVLKFAEDVKGFNVIDVFVEHCIDNPETEPDQPDSEPLQPDQPEPEAVQLESEAVQPESEAVQTEEDKSESEPVQTEPDQPQSEPVEPESEAVHGEDYLSEEDEDYVANSDDDDDDMGELYDDEDWDWISEIPTEIFVNVGDENSFERHENPRGNPGPSFATDFEENDVNSDDLDTPLGSEVDEENVRKNPKFNQPENSDEVRRAKNKQDKTEWLAKKFVPMLRHTPEMKPNGLIVEALDKWGVKLSKYQAYRAKVRAIEMIQGAQREQYAHLREYADELRRSNPNSTVIIKCGMSDIGPVFERIYVCLEACKAAFANTCRPLIGLDACFLKGEYGGQLIAAVGKDGNNQMIPIAYAVVEA